VASTSPGVGPAASIPGGSSNVVWATSVAGSTAASPGEGSSEMALSAAPGARAFARAAVLEGGGAFVLAASAACFAARATFRSLYILPKQRNTPRARRHKYRINF
jgi:hypothetical protein